MVINAFKSDSQSAGKSTFTAHMKSFILDQMDKIQLKLALYDKQKLYAQMVKDNITGPVKDQVQEEIAEINTRLYHQLKK